MPELPEVETVRMGLIPFMQGFVFDGVTLARPDLRFAFSDKFAKRLIGQSVVSLKRRAKFLSAELSSGERLLMHLGMSGRFTVSEKGPLGEYVHHSATDAKHDHVIFEMSSGARIIYNDPRRFGFMEIIAPGEASRLDSLGPEPLSNHFNGQSLYDNISKRKAPIKSLLLDQALVAGLGNIYVCEALYRAGLDPQRRGDQISDIEAERLSREIKNVLSDAVKAGGSTLRDFASADGSAGYFQHSFDVYGRGGEPCAQCGGDIARLTQSGRSTFYCPACQS